MPAFSIQLNNFIMPAAPRASAMAGTGSSWHARLTHALAQIRDRRMERDVASYIEAHGAHLTDDLERRIQQYFV